MSGHGGQAWLLADRATLARARRQLRGPALWFQRLQGVYLLLTAARVHGPSIAAVAARAGVDPAGLTATLSPQPRGRGCRRRPDPAGKPADTGPAAGPAAVLAHRLFGPAAAGLPRADADPRGAGGRRGHRAGAPGRRHRGARPVRGGPHRGRPVLALLCQWACPWPAASSPAAAPAGTRQHGNQWARHRSGSTGRGADGGQGPEGGLGRPSPARGTRRSKAIPAG